MREIVLANNRGVAIVDDHWFPILSRYKWHLTGKGYAERSIKPGYGIMMHRVINMTPSDLQVDHINGNKLDNCEANLRSCENRENARNRARKKPTKSGFKGVSIRPNGKFQAEIMVDGKSIYLGVFDTAIEAARVYDAAAASVHGRYALGNFAKAA